VDVTEEEDGYEIRTTACSNAADYLLANNIACAIKEMTDAVFMNEEGRELHIGTLFSDMAISEHTCADFEIVVPLSRQLSWSHFVELLPLKSQEARVFYAQAAATQTLGIKDERKKLLE
jgi:hypothetical protein